MVLAPEILQKGNHFMEKTSLITNPKVTGYLNRFYSPESQELMELRIGAEEAQVKQLGVPYEPLRNAYRVSVPNTAAATEMILKYPEIFRDYEIIKGKMDDVFLAVTGKKLVGGTEK